MNRILWAALFACSVLLIGEHAFAQTAVTTQVPANPPVAIPFGDWIASILAWLRDAAVAFASILVAKYLPAAVRQYLTNNVLGRAVDYAIAMVDGAVKGDTFTPTITSQVLTMAERYVVVNAPKLAAQIGDTLRAKLMARIAALGSVPANPGSAALAAQLPLSK